MDYDYTGQRVKKYGPFGLTTYPFPGYEIGSDGVKIKYIKLGNEILAAKKSTGEKLFYHNDHLGGINVITNDAAARAQLTEYDPWGKISRKEGDADPGKRFTGQEFDPEFDLYYYGGRYYDQDLGRFVSPDPFIQEPEEPQNLNRYSYVMNNPVNYIDPSGYGFWITFLQIFNILGGAAETGSQADQARIELRNGGAFGLGGENAVGGKSGVSTGVADGWGSPHHGKTYWYNTPTDAEAADMLGRGERVPLELRKEANPTNPADQTGGRAGERIRIPSADPRSTARPGLPIGFKPIEGPTTSSGRGSGSGVSGPSHTSGAGFSGQRGGAGWSSTSSLSNSIINGAANLSAGFGDTITSGFGIFDKSLTGMARDYLSVRYDLPSFVADRSSISYAAGESAAWIWAGATGGAVGARVAGWTTRIAIHGPHHTFGSLGRLSHIQMNYWRIGVKGSGEAIRMPLPWR